MATKPIPFAVGRSSYTEIFLRMKLESCPLFTFNTSFMIGELGVALEVVTNLQGHMHDGLVVCELLIRVIPVVVGGSSLLGTKSVIIKPVVVGGSSLLGTMVVVNKSADVCCWVVVQSTGVVVS